MPGDELKASEMTFERHFSVNELSALWHDQRRDGERCWRQP